MIETRVLKYFLTICNERSFTKAAKVLSVSQPALSKQIMQLENQLGTVLLRRNTNPIELTEEGTYLYSKACEILNIINSTESIFSDKESIFGNIRIGCEETPLVSRICEVYKSFRKKYINTNLQILSGDSKYLYDRFEDGTIDIAIIIGLDNKENLSFIETTHKDTLGILMNSDNPLASNHNIKVKDLANLPLIIPSNVFSKIDLAILDYSTLNVIGSYNGLYNAFPLIENNLASVLTVEHHDFNHLKYRNLVFRPFYPLKTINTYIVTKKNEKKSEILKLFLDELKTFGIIS